MDIAQAGSFHCPRWDELPALSLYMDQVLIIIQDAVGPVLSDSETFATATMINNYVKIKLIAPSEKKKYSREHIARLIMITLLKRVLSMSELDVLLRFDDTGKTYDSFCDCLESQLSAAFCGEYEKPDNASCSPLMSAAVQTLACKLRFESILNETVS